MNNLDAVCLALYVTAAIYRYLHPIDSVANEISLFVFLSFGAGLAYFALNALIYG